MCRVSYSALIAPSRDCIVPLVKTVETREIVVVMVIVKERDFAISS